MACTLYPELVEITIEDSGKGIEDIEKQRNLSIHPNLN